MRCLCPFTCATLVVLSCSESRFPLLFPTCSSQNGLLFETSLLFRAFSLLASEVSFTGSFPHSAVAGAAVCTAIGATAMVSAAAVIEDVAVDELAASSAPPVSEVSSDPFANPATL